MGSKKDSKQVKITERGWGAHYILAARCMFRRNTLIERGRTRIIVSTVGNLRDREDETKTDTVGDKRYYETQAFRATQRGVKPYWDADTLKPVNFKSPWCVDKFDRLTDLWANDMHEAVVVELVVKLRAGGKL